MDKTNSKDEVERLLCMYFPQYPPLEYRNVSFDKECFLVEVNLFDVNVCSEESFTYLEEAEEETAKLCLELLTSFLKALKINNTNTENEDEIGLKEVFDPLVKFMREFKPKLIAKQDGEVLNAVFSEEQWKSSFIGEELVGPLLDNITSEHGRNKEFSLDQIDTFSKDGTSPLEREDLKCNVSNVVEENAISFLFQHWQKKSQTLQPPIFEFFTKGPYHGCSLKFDGDSIIVPAVYKKRIDAKCEAARIGVAQIFGPLKKFTPLKPDEPMALNSWLNDKSIIEVNENAQISFNLTDDNVSNVSLKPWDHIQLNPLLPSQLQQLISIPTDTLDIKAPPGLNFVSLVNEYCQMNRLDLPKFNSITKNEGLNVISFCSSIDSFPLINGPIMSQSFSKKSEAKNDCAGRLYKILVERGLINPKTGKTVIDKQIQNQKRLQFGPIRKENFCYLPPPPPPPFKHIPSSPAPKNPPLDPKLLEFLIMKKRKEN